MLKVVECIADEHDLWLVSLSALICVLGCFTTTVLLAGTGQSGGMRSYQRLVFASAVFGGTVWSLHFVAMLAFMPGHNMAYDVTLTALSALVACAGAMFALIAWQAPVAPPWRIGVGGLLLGLAISGMHYIGVAAMTFAGFVWLDTFQVVTSIVASVGFATLALMRADTLARVEGTSQRGRVLEVAVWLSLAVCVLHYTGMAAITLAPSEVVATDGAVLGTSALAIAVGSVSTAILLGSLVAVLVEQHMYERALQDLSRMRLMSNLAQEVLLIHRHGVVLEVNSAGERLFKAPAAEIIGRPVLSLFSDASTAALLRRERCPPSERRPEEMSFQSIDGSQVAVELTCQPINYLGRPATVVALRDLTDRKRDEERIRHLARHDSLTGLPNRYALLERLDMALVTATSQKRGLAVLYIDLDRFKPVNDLYGHAAGDTLLVQVSKRILSEIRSADTLARIGGDEFIMILASDPQPEKVSAVATRVVDVLRRPFEVEGRRVEIGVSIGIALFPANGLTVDTLMRAADAAMYRVKEEGRGAMRFYEASMNAQLQARLQLKEELNRAVVQGELLLHYQPMVNGITGELETFEALIRWDHPKRGMIPPAEFIPLAEESGLINEIGQWIIEAACREAAGWSHPWRVSVNVSPRQFAQSDVCNIIDTALRAHGLKPSRLVVEITESTLMDDAGKAVATLNRLKESGVRVALDDFGTGYSSLSYLQTFRFDKLKIDKSFVRRLGESEDALTLTRTIINLGHNLGLHVTAEGVETPAQLAMLRALGCDQIQGYLVGRPAPVQHFTEFDRLRTANLFKDSVRRFG